MKIKAILAFVFIIAAPHGALASITVQEIPVEATAESAAKAKEIALSRGEQAAFSQLMEGIAPSFQADAVSSAKISASVESYDIVSESMTADSYKAVVNYNFNKDKIEAIAAGAPATGTPSEQKDAGVRDPLSGNIMVLVPVSSLKNWNTVKKDIASVKGVTSIELIAFSLSQADAVVRFSGSLQTLAGELSAKGYNVNQQANYWVIRK